MKKLTILIIFIMILSGCATAKVTTDIGTRIGTSFQEVAKKGQINAEKSIKAWPYVSGQLKGLLAGNYNYDLPKMATDIIENLDALAEKETLTNEEKGFVIGSFVRLETIAVRDSWEKYGVSIYNLLMQIVGG